jgi:hypothetical protein
MLPPGCWKVADMHQLGADIPLIILPCLPIDLGIAGIADRAQGSLLTHGNFFTRKLIP